MMRSIRNRVRNVLKNQNGSITMYTIIFMIFFLPFALWVGVNLPMKYQYTYEIKELVSNTADSMISRLDYDELAKGHVKIDEVEAVELAEDMIRSGFNLDTNDNPSGEGILKETIPIREVITIDDSNLSAFADRDGAGVYTLSLPSIQNKLHGTKQEEELVNNEIQEKKGVHLYIINEPSTAFKIKGINSPITETTVIVHAVIPVENGGLLGGRTVIHRTGVSEAQINTNFEVGGSN